MLVKVETKTTKRLVDVTSSRVSLDLSEEEAIAIKMALEYLRSPVTWGEERIDTLYYNDVNELIRTLENAQIYADGVYAD